MGAGASFDPVWEDIYGGGHAERYPWDAVVSFVFRCAPRDRPRADVGIVEIGCGVGNNLWFAAREGFRVAGIDGSESAIDHARQWFAREGLQGDLRVGDFTELPFESDSFDIALDRGALTCVARAPAAKAVGEVHRVLKRGGLFFCTPYSDVHTSAQAGHAGEDGLTRDIAAGAAAGVGPIRFYDRAQVDALFAGGGWTVKSLKHMVLTELVAGHEVQAEWRVIAEKR